MSERVGSILRVSEIAELLERSVSWFYAHRVALEKTGLPKRDAVLGGWHRPAVEQWLARRAGIRPSSAPTAKDRLRGAINAHADALRNAAD